MTPDRKLEEFAQIFRCTVETAPRYIERIHERIGHEVALDTILAVIRKIPAKRLTMDLIVERLRKLERTPVRTRTVPIEPGGRSAPEDEAEAGASVAARAPRKASAAPAPQPLSPVKVIAAILTSNWERGRRQGLKPTVMTADLFVRRTQSVAGTPKPTVARILKSIQKLDRRDVLLTPNLVADDINESDKL